MRQKLKVLMFTDYFPPHVGGGVEKVVYEVSSALAEMGHTVGVVALNTAAGLANETLNKVAVRRIGAINLSNLLGLQVAVPSLASPFRVISYTKSFRPDLIHVHNLFFSTTALGTLASRVHNIPLVTTLHLGDMSKMGGGGSILSSAYEGTLGQFLLRRATSVVCVSEAVKNHAIYKLGVPKEKVALIPNGVRASDFDVRHGSNGGLKIALVGRLIRNKGVQFLISAAPEILKFRDDVEFEIVGTGPMRKELEKMVEERGLEKYFRFESFVPDVSSYLARCDVLIRPSTSEGMPLVVLEAMAAGLPVIASDVGGTREVLRNGVTGILVPPGDVTSLTAAVGRVISDRDLARQLGSNARTFAESFYDWKKIADLYASLYETVLKEARGRS